MTFDLVDGGFDAGVVDDFEELHTVEVGDTDAFNETFVDCWKGKRR